MPRITNIAGYKFVPLADLKPTRDRLLTLCKGWELKGSILLSREGINLFVAGVPENVEYLIGDLRAIPGLEDLELKLSDSDEQPFRRMLVKIKQEIIAFGVEGIEPGRRTSPKLSASELKQWLDEGRPVTLLDTRNDYEVKLGTFAKALPIGIDHFRDFPEAVRRLPAEMKQQPIVMFCTGGIRCEKAGPFMEQEGFEQIYQLDGGILKYFEECGGDHYVGECFVFDKRVGLDPSLAESGSSQCYACQAPLTTDEQRHPHYQEGISCPHCYRPSEVVQANELQTHQSAIQQLTQTLPGSIPYDNLRPLKVPLSYAQETLLDFLNGILSHFPPGYWEGECERGLLLDGNRQIVRGDHRVREGDRYYHRQPATREPDVNAAIRLLYEDEAIIVIDKPAPLPVHPSGRFNKNTLQSILAEVYTPQKPRPAHRLDANTTGVIVFSRTAAFSRLVQPQFERGEVEKVYLARVIGHPVDESFSCTAPIRDSAGELGARGIDEENGLPSQTNFRVLARLVDGTSLLEVRPLTGRTNQIRVHLWHLGLPIQGDQTYQPSLQLGTVQTRQLEDAPLCLHALRLTFCHPLTQERVVFEAPQPEWAEGF